MLLLLGARSPLSTGLCLLLLVLGAAGVCYDQSPFWFMSEPSVESLYDEQGNMLSNKVKVKWGAMHNFKCVDYFQESYAQLFLFEQRTTLLLSHASPRLQCN